MPDGSPFCPFTVPKCRKRGFTGGNHPPACPRTRVQGWGICPWTLRAFCPPRGRILRNPVSRSEPLNRPGSGSCPHLAAVPRGRGCCGLRQSALRGKRFRGSLLSRLRMKWDREPAAPERGSMSRSSLAGRMGERTFVDAGQGAAAAGRRPALRSGRFRGIVQGEGGIPHCPRSAEFIRQEATQLEG